MMRLGLIGAAGSFDHHHHHPLRAPLARLIMDGHRRHRSQQIVGERRVGELEVTFVVKLEQRRRERMILLQMQIVHLRFARRVTTFLAHIHLQKYIYIKYRELISILHPPHHPTLTFVRLSLYAY